MGATDVHTCPRCELRFAATAEMEDHLLTDHHVVLRRPAYPMRMRTHRVPEGTAPEVHGVVVVAVDPSHGLPAVLDFAAAVARQAGFGLDLIAARPTWMSVPATEAHLAARGRDAAVAGVPSVAWHVLGTDDPAEEILRHVGETSPALLCMATRSRGALGEALLGSVSEAVLRRSPAPVLLVGPKAAPPVGGYSQLVVGIDGSDLAAKAALVATELAGLLGIEVFMVEVRDPAVPFPEDASETADLARLSARLPVPPAGYDVLHGRDPARAMLDYVEHQKDHLFLVGTHGRRGLRRLTMGSVALELVRHAHGPVIVVPGRAPIVDGGGPSPVP